MFVFLCQLICHNTSVSKRTQGMMIAVCNRLFLRFRHIGQYYKRILFSGNADKRNCLPPLTIKQVHALICAVSCIFQPYQHSIRIVFHLCSRNLFLSICNRCCLKSLRYLSFRKFFCNFVFLIIDTEFICFLCIGLPRIIGSNRTCSFLCLVCRAARLCTVRSRCSICDQITTHPAFCLRTIPVKTDLIPGISILRFLLTFHFYFLIGIQ